MPAPRGRPPDHEAHERILAAAYELFRLEGTRAVGVDTVVERAGVSKMTLYRHFKSKDQLVAAFLDRRAQVWVVDWLVAEIFRRAETPADRLMAVFDVFDSWFRSATFDRCSFIRTLLEYPDGHPTHRAACQHLATLRAFIAGLARDAGIKDGKFADAWLMMVKGSSVAAVEGNRSAARQIKPAARLFLESQLPKEGPPKRRASKRDA